MKILIDMQGAQTSSRNRGIGRYTLSITKALLKNNTTDEIILFFNAALPQYIEDIINQLNGLISKNNIHIWNPPQFKDQNDKNYAKAETQREQYINEINPDLLIITSLFEGYLSNAVTSIKKINNNFKTVVILYDLIPYIDQTNYLTNEYIKKYYFSKINYLKQADFYFAISHSSQNEAIDHLNIEKSKIINIKSAVDDIFKPQILPNYKKSKLLYKYNIKDKFIFYVPGGFDYRKNFKTLIEAYSILPDNIKNEYQLLIGSKVTQQQKEHIHKLAKESALVKSQVILSGYIPDSDLIHLYSQASLFVFPSLHEGFGLPLLEAMSCKTAVIGSNTSSIPEVIQNKDQLFNPNNPQEIADLIQQILSNTNQQKSYATLSYQNSKNFSWHHSANILLDFIHNT